MGVGKSTAIEIVRTLYPKHSVRLVKFAQPLYDMQEMIYDRIDRVYQRPSDFKKDRKLLQWLGTDWGRDTISTTLWVDLWKAAAQEAGYDAAYYQRQEAVIVCDDVRFDNEAETVRSMGGTVIKLTRPDNTSHAEGGVGIVAHKSELGVSPSLIDHTVENNGTLEEFRQKLINALGEKPLDNIDLLRYS